MLPIDVYARNEKALREEQRTSGPAEDVTQLLPFRLLAKDPSARVVINCKRLFDRCLIAGSLTDDEGKSTATLAMLLKVGEQIHIATSSLSPIRTLSRSITAGLAKALARLLKPVLSLTVRRWSTGYCMTQKSHRSGLSS